jgi:hypothetical protein
MIIQQSYCGLQMHLAHQTVTSVGDGCYLAISSHNSVSIQPFHLANDEIPFAIWSILATVRGKGFNTFMSSR